MRTLKDQPGDDLGLTGSISICHQLIEADLVNEYRLFVYPVVLGRGARLFVEGGPRRDLRLVEVEQFRSGVVLVTYRPDRG